MYLFAGEEGLEIAATQAQFIYRPGFYIVLFKGKAVKVIVK